MPESSKEGMTPQKEIAALKAQIKELQAENKAVDKANTELMERLKAADAAKAVPGAATVVTIGNRQFQLLGGAIIDGQTLNKEQLAENQKALKALLGKDSELLKPLKD
jgi:regulator of replication initiation timing